MKFGTVVFQDGSTVAEAGDVSSITLVSSEKTFANKTLMVSVTMQRENETGAIIVDMELDAECAALNYRESFANRVNLPAEGRETFFRELVNLRGHWQPDSNRGELVVRISANGKAIGNGTLELLRE